MRQSTVIFGTLLFAFVIYITVRGQLPAYLSLFTGADAPAPSGGSSGAKSQGTFDQVFNKFSEYAKTVGIE